MASFGRIYSYLGNPRTTSALVISRLNGLDVELVDTQPRRGVDNKYRTLNPLAKVPTFQGADGFVLTETIAINVYLASQPPRMAALKERANRPVALLGHSPKHLASILRWLSYANSELHSTARTWFRPLLGIDPYPSSPAVIDAAAIKTKQVLQVLEDHLSTPVDPCESNNAQQQSPEAASHNTSTARWYLVSGEITLADYFVAAIVSRLFEYVLGVEERKVVPNVVQWWYWIVKSKEWTDVMGEMYVCERGMENKPPAAPAGWEVGSKRR